MIEKSNSTSLALATIAILGQPPSQAYPVIFQALRKTVAALANPA
ncbi:hypothetical protein [Nitrosomonas sp. ANs5]